MKRTRSRKTIPPEPTELTEEEKREELRKALGVASLDNTFENFEPVPGTQKALAAVKALASGKTKWKMLLLYGGVGNGKSHLCDAAVIEMYKRGLFSRVVTMGWVLRVLKDSMGKGAFTPYSILIYRYCHADRLILDDVGMGGSGSDWEESQLEEIISHRYHENLFTIVTTNLDIDQLPIRIVSRFRRDPEVGRIVLNKGAEYGGLKK